MEYKKILKNEEGFMLTEVVISMVLFMVLLTLIGKILISGYVVSDKVQESAISEAIILNGANFLTNQLHNTTAFNAIGYNYITIRVVDDRGPGNVPIRQTITYFYYDPDTTTVTDLNNYGLDSNVAIPNAAGLVEYKVTDLDNLGNQVFPTTIRVLIPGMVAPTSANPLFSYYEINNELINIDEYYTLEKDLNQIVRVNIHLENKIPERENNLQINTSATPYSIRGY